MAVSEYNFKYLWVALSISIACGLSSCGPSGSGDGSADVSTASAPELSPVERFERGLRCNNAYAFFISNGDEAVKDMAISEDLAISEVEKSRSLFDQDRKNVGLSDTEIMALEDKSAAEYTEYFAKLPSGEPDYGRAAPGAAEKALATFFDCNAWYNSRTS
ncbi:hypothetical protein [Brevundimonas sp.]|uniref:hypothetical protein n=1 Tax=Brevundimonas sp. TaxID=1871086 RepID=UPI0026136ECB|nr:hypothetical protein [Brevundimonas sp.]